mmetsp:Transcript_18163/g.28376  ORF Transcript_18163/g.28376 Transcript_18163/m.28376 type:complete len:431 (-) Transcript_18163:675-1967(-)
MAKLCRLARRQGQPHRRPAAQHIEGQRQQNRKSHDFQRQNPVHPFTDRGIGGERRHAPSPERDAGLQAHHPLALQIGIGRQRGPIRRGTNRALNGALRGLTGQCRLLRAPAPARFGGQNDLAHAVGHQNSRRNSRPGAFKLLQIHLDHDHAQHITARRHPARIGKGKAAGLAGGNGENRIDRAQGIDEIGFGPVGRSKDVAIRRRYGAAITVQQHEVGRPDLLHKRDQPLGGLLIIRRIQRANQRGIARQQLGHNGAAAQFTQQVARIKRQPQFRPVARRFGKPVRQQRIGQRHRDHRHHGEQRKRQTHAPADGACLGRWCDHRRRRICHNGQHRLPPVRAQVTPMSTALPLRGTALARPCRHGPYPPPVPGAASCQGRGGFPTGYRQCRARTRWGCWYRRMRCDPRPPTDPTWIDPRNSCHRDAQSGYR